MGKWSKNPNEWTALHDPTCDLWQAFVDRNPSTIRTARAWQRKRERLGLPGFLSVAVAEEQRGFSTLESRRFVPSEIKTYEEELEIEPGGGIVVYADVHVPVQDSLFMDKVADLGAAWGIKNALLAGDFLDMQDWSWFTKPLAEQSAKFHTELEVAREVFGKLESLYDKIWWSMGNHEYRITRSTNSKLGMKALSMMIGASQKLVVSDYSMTVIKDAPGLPYWRVTHPDQTRKVPLSWAREQASMKLQHIVVAHSHRPAIGFDMSGTFYTIETGMMADPKRLGYTRLKDTSHAEPQQGALILKRGENGRLVPYIVTPKSDFKALERMYHV